ncbi:NAD(P)H nitroreductase [Mycobacterium sp. Y57]|uniref:Acg family FMN-binding oxidoreductase n=1 Tax=Mycolicibacterium xanthum TaxID=2796469 RepID=UPI001C852B0F|nr:NAD(P)H nitroreductase [Mycolicibacterium xanthum]MBX7435340.1 NAD(P)H nitroreductase [Mycolicibacterium xanthum]
MPATKVQTEVIVDALRLACRAPSLHNSQPWRWVLAEHTIDLFADPERLVRSTDDNGRQALLSCGAVLDHFRVAMAAAGWDTQVTRFPDPSDPLHVASVQFTSAGPVSAESAGRADAILARHTDRLPLAAPPDPNRLASLGATDRPDTIRVDVVADELRDALIEASHLTEAMRLYDSEYHAELYWWTADFVTDDGIPSTSLVSAEESERVQVARTFPVVPHADRRRSEYSDDQAAIMVLSTGDDSRESVLRCGEALSAVLLDATATGLSTCTLTHITEIPRGRDVIASLLDSPAIPQVLVRIGRTPALEGAPPPTPRRPIEHVLRIDRE